MEVEEEEEEQRGQEELVAGEEDEGEEQEMSWVCLQALGSFLSLHGRQVSAWI